MSIITVKSVSKQYANHKALDDVTLEIPPYSIYGLLGPNGAGKTTLIRIINQIITPDSGEIFINGEKLEPKHIGLIGYLPEERGLYKKMKVAEQLMYLARLKGLPASIAKERIRTWLKRFDLEQWWNRNVEDLSKGMQQKVQFISTVVHEPSILILDEPFSGFDPINANILKEEILNYKQKGATVIFSTHRMESVEELCDHICMINKSQKVLDGKKTEIKETFKQNIYSLIHNSSVTLSGEAYEIISSEENEGNYFTRVKTKGMSSPNELLQALIPQTEIHSFTEEIPSMNDIFITKVKNEGNE